MESLNHSHEQFLPGSHNCFFVERNCPGSTQACLPSLSLSGGFSRLQEVSLGPADPVDAYPRVHHLINPSERYRGKQTFCIPGWGLGGMNWETGIDIYTLLILRIK